MQDLQPGDPLRIGPYRLVGRLGSGGMGRVFAGRSAGGRLVAVKVIRDDLAADPDFRVRFGREVAAAKAVSGLFTAPVVDADVNGPTPWLATAYVAGPSLADAVRRHGPLPAPSVRALAAGLAEGLSVIHAAGLVHRDLKPSNVLLADDGPRVIDFGISRAAEASSLTQADLVVGSPGFMSPEQAEGHPAGPPSDVFSLGAVLAFAATGAGPFGSGSTAALVYRVVHSPPNLAAVPPGVRSLAERCLAKTPGHRPTTADLLAELDGTDLTPGWLPASITDGISPAEAAAGTGGPEAWPATDPVWAPGTGRPDQSTVTAAPRSPASSTPPGVPGLASLTSTSPRHRRRPVLLTLLVAGVLAVASAGAVLALYPGAVGPRAGKRPTGTAAALARRSPGVSASARSPAPRTGGKPPAAPTHVTATALNADTIRVAWTADPAGLTGLNISNGCAAHGCSGGALNVRTGPVTSADVTTTPGAYQCFYVQAFNSSGTSAWAGPGCISTPGIDVPSNRAWTDTGVTVHSGTAVGISAAGQVYLAASHASQPPGGDSSCTPVADYAASSAQFPAPQLPCWSLIARIGHGQPFEVGTSILVTATTGRLYLGVNDNIFAGNAGIWTVKIKLGGLP